MSIFARLFRTEQANVAAGSPLSRWRTEEGLYYLAAPYSDASASVRRYRRAQINRVTAQLLLRGIHVFSPISHSAELAETHGLPGCFDFWRDFDLKVLTRCDGLFVLRLHGWEESRGVKAEIAAAEEAGLPTVWLSEDGREFGWEV